METNFLTHFAAERVIAGESSPEDEIDEAEEARRQEEFCN